MGYIFWYSDILYSDVLFDRFWHFIWHICWHSIWHLFWHSIWHCTWYCICHTFRWISLTSYSDILTFISDMHSYILSNIYSDILWHSICHHYCIWHRFRGSPEILRAWILTRELPRFGRWIWSPRHEEPIPLAPFFIKGSLGGETSVLRTFRMSGKELVKERVSKERVRQGKSSSKKELVKEELVKERVGAGKS